ncbi:MAG TPA: hypothetical protein ENF38_01015 [Candidatus Aenigmarchaeota archaeon]|nr:hypothetical protein [Candidatus Aenigmarchaeota archaeon]
MVFSQTLDAGLLLLIAVVFAHYIGIRKKSERGWSWLTVAGVFLIFGGIPTLGGTAITGVDLSIIPMIFNTVGWILALVGVLFIAYEILLER